GCQVGHKGHFCRHRRGRRSRPTGSPQVRATECQAGGVGYLGSDGPRRKSRYPRPERIGGRRATPPADAGCSGLEEDPALKPGKSRTGGVVLPPGGTTFRSGPFKKGRQTWWHGCSAVSSAPTVHSAPRAGPTSAPGPGSQAGDRVARRSYAVVGDHLECPDEY